MPSRGLTLVFSGLPPSLTSFAKSAFAQDATPSAECASTTADENMVLGAAFFDAVANRRGAALANFLAPDHVYHELSVDESVATPESGAEGASERADDRQEAIIDLAVTVDPIIAEGNLMSPLMTWTGKVADTGMDVTWNSAGFFRIECGKIAENWVVADTLGRLVTSGEIPRRSWLR